MPYNIRKLPNQPFYRVTNSNTGEVRAKRTTKKKAESQVRLLMSIDKKRSKNTRKVRKNKTNKMKK